MKKLRGLSKTDRTWQARKVVERDGLLALDRHLLLQPRQPRIQLRRHWLLVSHSLGGALAREEVRTDLPTLL